MKKSTHIRFLAWSVLSLVLLVAMLSRCALQKPEMLAQIHTDCVQNVRQTSSWQADLMRFQVSDTSENARDYCRCTLVEPLSRLGVRELGSALKNPEMIYAKLGDEATLQQRSDACFKQLNKRLSVE